MTKFEIDFFELIFLAEACIPPRPIARSVFWSALCDKHYQRMSHDERARAFDWIKPKLDLDNKDCRLFYARFNPKNQFRIKATFEFKQEEFDTFKFNDEYHISETIHIDFDCIDSIRPLF